MDGLYNGGIFFLRKYLKFRIKNGKEFFVQKWIKEFIDYYIKELI